MSIAIPTIAHSQIQRNWRHLKRLLRFGGSVLLFRPSGLPLAPAAWVGVASLVYFMFAVQALNAHFVSGLILAVCIVAVILIDARCFIIPDWACLVIALTGAVTVTTFEPETLVERSTAAICAYAAFRGLNFVYRKWSGIDGLGHGDAKLIAAGCFWLRANSVAFAVLLASVSALMAVAISRSRSTRFGSKSRLPFGPHIALAIWIVWLSSIG